MATAPLPPTNPRKLLLQPQHIISQYRRLLLSGSILLGGLIVLSWLFVMATRQRAQWESPVRLVSSSQPLTFAEKPAPPPPTPPPPEPPRVQQSYSLPPTRTVTTRSSSPAKEDADAKRRKEALLKALRASVKVDNFSLDSEARSHVSPTPVALQQETPIEPRQTLEIPSSWTPAQAANTAPVGQSWAPNERLVGRSQRFWQQSSYGNAAQWLAATVEPPRSPYTLHAGTVVPAILTQELNSDLEGALSAIVTRDVFDSITGTQRVIPQGARLFGLYDAEVQTNSPRLHLAFKTLYFPNGYSLSLNGMPGVDRTGMAGVSDQVNRHFWQRYGSAAVLSLVTAGISLAIHRRSGFYSYGPEDAATYGAGQVMGQAVGEDLRQQLRIRPTLTVPAGYVFNLLVSQDIVFPGPYPFTASSLALRQDVGQ